jgi:hypothetical protein
MQPGESARGKTGRSGLKAPSARLALTAGFLVTALSAAFVLTRSPPLLAATNSVPIEAIVATTPGGAHACQENEVLPAGTTGVRISLETGAGPRVSLKILSGSRIVAQGERGPGWVGGSVTIPVKPLPRAVTATRVCFGFAGANEEVTMYGRLTPPSSAAVGSHGTLKGRLGIEYLRPGRSSWWSLIPTVARHLGLGRAWAGTWVAVFVLALTLSAAAAASWLALRELR